MGLLVVLLCMFLLSVGLAYGVDRSVRLDAMEATVFSCHTDGLHATWDHSGHPNTVNAVELEVFDAACDGALVVVTVADGNGGWLGEAASEVRVPVTRIVFEPGSVATQDVGHVAVVVVADGAERP